MLRQLFLTLARNTTAQEAATHSRLLRPAVRRFVAGETLTDGIAAVAALNARGIEATLDVLGEATASEEDARQAARDYFEVLNAIFHRGLRSHVSLKLSQMGLDLAVDLAADLLAAIARTAAAVGTFVRVDMEDSTRLPRTLQVFDRVWESGLRNIGIALQAYLYRTPQDLERYLNRGVSIRLCKGAYAEPPAVAYPRKADVDAAYRRLSERLLRDGVSPALATHDERLIRHARAFAASHGIARDCFEFQFLYGIRRDLQEALAAEGYRVRVYVPFGTHWYPYFMRRLAERPANVLFLARHVLRP
ncbi:MAG: proline dehydrogenase family protein [Armatimonadota bacterium]|nr:proline dehydrogenase family protein [Armatimonadota bacterium]MDR7547667.1 proline dehydrogenase family protein [Armatimonadota bacterium]